MLVLAGGIIAFVASRPANAHPDVLTHKVKRERLDVTVVEKGTLESADNLDIVCRVKAGQKGFASTINWVIPDGSRVVTGDRLMILDDSALQEQLQAQQIVVDTSEAAKIKADEDLTIVRKQNESDIAAAQTAVVLAEIELEKYLGVEFDEERTPLASLIGVPAALSESGVYRQTFDDLTGQVRLAESEVEQNRERAAWANRMVKQKYMSSAQAQSEQSRLASSVEKLRSLESQKNLLVGYERKMMLTDLKSKLDLAKRTLDQKNKEAHSKEVQAESEQRHKLSLYMQSVDKFRELKDQIEQCKIKAPRDGMVVYFKQESSRFSSNSTGMIEQGQPVKEGQKMLRIPNLSEMQVNTKVHEAMVKQIRSDKRISTGIIESFRGGNAWQPNPFGRLVTQRDDFLETIREGLKEQEYRIALKGSPATVKVDAVGDRQFKARVKTMAAVASQAESWISDVKLFPTIVLIEEKVEGLKPDASAEVTIQVDGADNVLCIPVQAVYSSENSPARKVFVKNAEGNFDEREVVLGLFNQKMIEVKEGLQEGDEVVTNPKVLLGETKAKPREGDGPAGDSKGQYPPADKGSEGGGNGESGSGGASKKSGKKPADPSPADGK